MPASFFSIIWSTIIVASMLCRFGMYEEEIGLAMLEGEELKCDEKEKEFINWILSEQLKEAMHIIKVNKDVIERMVEAVNSNR